MTPRRQKKLKQSSRQNFKLKNWFRLLFLIICGLMIGFNVYLANANGLVGNQLPMPFGYGAAVVLSGSMEPEFSEGDLILIKETKDYKQNDIVVFQGGNNLIVHRIIDIDGETITTKGDANKTADEPINVSTIKGKVLFWIPFLGNVVSFLKTPLGTVCIITSAIALIEIPHRREKKKDDEDRQKIIEEIERLKKEKQL